MENFISVVIPNRNGSATIGKCLESVFSSRYKRFEVIVVDDCSDDDSVDIIKRFPCKLIQLKRHSGASRARNVGAENSSGDILFFIDADCVLREDTLSIVHKTFSESSSDTIIGGTYTRVPFDRGFFSTFQSVFVNYSETKKTDNPDYIATHAMVIDAHTFKDSGGFREDFLPILEDVEFSHRLRKRGYKLHMNPEILVQHIFNYNLIKSLRNGFRKSKYWTMYSIKNRDLFVDSGTASLELKVNVVSYFLSLLLIALWIYSLKGVFLYPLPIIYAFNIFVNRKLIKAFYDTKGLGFACLALLYYLMVYPLAVGIGAIAGVITYIFNPELRKLIRVNDRTYTGGCETTDNPTTRG